MSKILSDLPPPKAGLIGHRGAPGIAPENTLSSFVQAAKLGLNWVEFDVQQCQTGEWIVMHDETLERTTNGNGRVEKVSYDYLKNLDAGTWFNPEFKNEPIPLLNTALACLNTLKIHPNIEIKATKPKSKKILQDFLEQIQISWPTTLPQPLVSSSDLKTLEQLRTLSPTLPLGYIVQDHFETNLDRIIEYHLDTLHCHYSIANENTLQMASEKDIPLLIYTVNKPEQIESLVAMGAYGVFSDMTL